MKNSKEILKDLKSDNNSAFGDLYKRYFKMVQRYVVNNSGNTEDAEDVFQDTMVVLIEKLRRQDFVLSATLKTYIFAISKYIWLKRLRTNKYESNILELNAFDLHAGIDRMVEEESTYWDKLHGYLAKISAHCSRLINDMFFLHKSAEQIKNEYGYTTKHNVTNQKYKCVEQIRKLKEEEDKYGIL